MRILLVITGLCVGGAERLVTNLADCFAASDHQVTLVYLRGPAAVKPNNPQVRLVDLQINRCPWAVFRGMFVLRQLIREVKPDVINSHLFHANILLRILRLVTPMRLVCSEHNANPYDTGGDGRLRIVAYRITDGLADLSTNVSCSAAESYVARGALRPHRMIHIHNGVDVKSFTFDEAARARLRRELLPDSETPLLMSVGRLQEQKDYPNLLHALRWLQEMGVKPKLAIAGGGPQRAELAELADSLAIANQVTFLGVRRDVAALMAACDVFVLSSFREGFGLVVAEAMACERVVVATDCGGVREIIGDAGFLVPPRDSRALAASLIDALNLGEMAARELGICARARILDQYSIEATAARYLSVFGRLQAHATSF